MRGLMNFDLAFFKSENYFGFPELPCVSDMNYDIEWYSFPNRSKCSVYANSGVHFFVDDFTFERIWNDPERFCPDLARFGVVIQPDFSLYYNFPVVLQMYNKFRNHWISRFINWFGGKVIPNVNVSTPDCWEWSFIGYPKNSVLAFSEIGSLGEKEDRKILYSAYDEMIRRLDPVKVLYFTRKKEAAPYECIPVVVPFGRLN